MKHKGAKIITLAINYIFALVEAVLGLRFILKLFAANPATPFVDWVYDTTAPLLEPFENIFSAPVLESGVILEFTTLFALIIYAIVAYLLIYLVEIIDEALSADSKK